MREKKCPFTGKQCSPLCQAYIIGGSCAVIRCLSTTSRCHELTHKLLSKITFEDMPKLLEFMKLIANKIESLKMNEE